MHIARVYEDDIGLENIHPGSQKLNKIKEERINLIPRHQIRVTLATQVNKFNVSIFDMYLSVFSHPVTRRKCLRFFLDLGELWGEGGGENFHKYLFFLTSFVLFYTLKEHKKWIKIGLYMSRGVASKQTHLMLKKWHSRGILIFVIRRLSRKTVMSKMIS